MPVTSDGHTTREPEASALRYAARGWAVFPVHTVESGACSCRQPGCSSPAKHPLTPHGCLDGTTDPDRIRAWAARWPFANWGIRTGPASNLLVLDIDAGPGGEDTIRDLQRRYGRLPEGPWVHTGGGGWHLYLAWPGGTTSLQTAGKLGPGVDTRGNGGYVVAPPSAHISGRRYEWEVPGAPQPAPEWIVTLIRQEPGRLGKILPTGVVVPLVAAVTRETDGHHGAVAERALEGACRVVAEATAGGRNDKLNWAAYRLADRIAARQIDEKTVADALLRAARACGLPETEAAKTIASGLGQRKQSA